MVGIERRVVKAERQQRLGVTGLMHVQTLVVEIPRAVVVHAAKNYVARVGTRLDGIEQRRQRNAAPFADGAPALDAIVSRDLRLLRHRLQLGQ